MEQTSPNSGGKGSPTCRNGPSCTLCTLLRARLGGEPRHIGGLLALAASALGFPRLGDDGPTR